MVKIKTRNQIIALCTFLIYSLSAHATQKNQPSEDTLKKVTTYQMNEITVTGTRSESTVRDLPMSISVVSGKQIQDRQLLSVLPVLNEQVPGLFITSRGVMGYGISTGAAGSMKMRGIGGNPTTAMLVLIDGEPQFMGLMGHPFADIYQNIMADRVEVVRGPASLLYGSNAMGGVINIVSAKLFNDTVINSLRVGYGSYNSIEPVFTNRISKGRFSSSAAISYNKTDGHRENSEFKQITGNIRLGYSFSQNWRASANMTFSRYNTSNPGAVSNPIIDNDAKISRGVSLLSLENKYDRTSGALKFFYNWGVHDINDGYFAGSQPLAYKFWSFDQMTGLSAYQSFFIKKSSRITAGLDYQNFGGNAQNRFTGGQVSNLVDTTLYDIAGYLDFSQKLGNLVTFDAGVRYDYNSQTGAQWVPQAGVSLHLPAQMELKVMAGKGFRNPTIKELFMFMSQNPNLLPEKLFNYEVSFSQSIWRNRVSYSLSLFKTDGTNIIQTQFINGRPQNVNALKISNRGVELSLNILVNKFITANANYSFLSMKYPVIAAPERKLFAGIDFKQNRLNISAGVQYVNGLYTAVNPVKKENFTLLNIRGSYKAGRYISLFATGENLLGTGYQVIEGYPMPRATFTTGFEIIF